MVRQQNSLRCAIACNSITRSCRKICPTRRRKTTKKTTKKSKKRVYKRRKIEY